MTARFSPRSEAENEQRHAPLFDAVVKYARSGKVSFHTPGHKHGRGIYAPFLRFLGRHMESLHAYDAVLGQNPQDVNALKGKREVLLALNRTEEANLVQQSIGALQSRKILLVGSSAKPALEAAVVGDYTS